MQHSLSAYSTGYTVHMLMCLCALFNQLGVLMHLLLVVRAVGCTPVLLLLFVSEMYPSPELTHQEEPLAPFSVSALHAESMIYHLYANC